MTPTVAMFRSAESVAVSKLTDDMLVVRAHAEFDEMTATPLMVELLGRFEGLLDQYQTLEKLDRELANYGLDADDVEVTANKAKKALAAVVAIETELGEAPSGSAATVAARFAANEAKLVSGSGSPEGAVTGVIGTIYVNTAGGANTTLYVKTSGSGNTGWTAK